MGDIMHGWVVYQTSGGLTDFTRMNYVFAKILPILYVNKPNTLRFSQFFLATTSFTKESIGLKTNLSYLTESFRLISKLQGTAVV